jgi:hypothetical protein
VNVNASLIQRFQVMRVLAAERHVVDLYGFFAVPTEFSYGMQPA